MGKEIIASGTLSVLDLNDAILLGEAPSNPVEGTLWIDNSTDPNVLYMWNGSSWVKQQLSVDDLDPDFAEELQELKDQVASSASDGIISSGEKLNIKLLLVEITGQIITDDTLPTLTQIDSKAGGQVYTARIGAQEAGVPTTDASYTAFESAYNTLKSYLESLSPRPWLTGDTEIDPTTWLDKWNTYYETLAQLQVVTNEYLADSLKPGEDYNGVVMTSEEGIVVTRSDNKSQTILNATNGIVIQRRNSTSDLWTKVFYADTDGVINATGLKISTNSSIGDTLVSDVVSNANAGAEAKEDLDNLAVGGRNLLQTSMWKSADTIDGYTITINKPDTTKYYGCYFSVVSLEANTEYVFSYKVKKIDGVLELIGGHIDSGVATAYSATLDGVSFTYPSATGSSTLDDGDYHEVVLKFTTSETPDGNIYVQPNRTSSTAVSAEVIDWQLEKGNTKTEWTPAIEDVEATVDSKVDSVQIGGNNLIWYSDLERYRAKWKAYRPAEAELNIEDQWAHVTITTEGSNNGLTPLTSFYNTEDEITAGETYQLSFNAKVNTGTLALNYIYIMSSGGNFSLSKYPTISTTEERYTIPFTPSSGNTRTDFSVLIGARTMAAGTVLSVKDIKLEHGTKPTDYSVSTHDLQLDGSKVDIVVDEDNNIKASDIAYGMSVSDDAVSIVSDMINISGKVSFNSFVTLQRDENGDPISNKDEPDYDENFPKYLGTDQKWYHWNEFMSDLFLQEGDETVIDGGKIKTNSIQAKSINFLNAKVEKEEYNLDGDVIYTETTFEIKEDGSVFSAGTFQSLNYSPQALGWIIAEDGSAELNDAYIRGDLLLPNAGITNDGTKGSPNLLNNSDLSSLVTATYGWDTALHGTIHPQDWTLYNSGVTTPSIGYHALVDQDSFKVATIRFTNLNSEYGLANRWMGASQSLDLDTIEAGKTYTFSFEHYADTSGFIFNGGLYYYKTDATSAGFYSGQFSETITTTRTWQTCTFTFTTDDAYDTTKKPTVYFYGHTGAEGVGWIRNMKLEEGELATPWSPTSSEMSEQVRFWAGTSFEDKESAPFRVLHNGTMYATNGYFEGTFSGSVQVGNILISDSEAAGDAIISINDQNNTNKIYLGESVAKFNTTAYFGTTQGTFLEIDSTNEKLLFGSEDFQIDYSANQIKMKDYSITGDDGFIFESNGNSVYDFAFTNKDNSAKVLVDGSLSVNEDIELTGILKMRHATDSGNAGVDFVFF